MPHYYDAKPEGILQPKLIKVRARGQSIELWSAKGIFSKYRLDAGTSLLLDACILEPGWQIHDLGCGNGVVGCILKLTEPNCCVLASDVNAHAVELAKRNSAKLCNAIDVRHSDGYAAIPERFDSVLFNPPYVAGRTLVMRLVKEAYEHLMPGGLLQLVARHNKGGAMLKLKMLEVFGNCDDTRRAKGYRLYISKKQVLLA